MVDINIDKEYVALLHELDDRLVTADKMDVEPGPERAAVKWREQTRESVQELIFPITISWMDDGETMSEEGYAQRALDDVKARFERLASSFPCLQI